MPKRARAWAVHLYTAAGSVIALCALFAALAGDYAVAFGWLAAAFLIDCTDGTLARAVRVKEVVPEFDGAKLDDITDYLTYVFVPLAIAYHAGLVPGGAVGLAACALPLLASCYGFCNAEAKTADHLFTGFPSYWNITVLYMMLLGTPRWFNVLTLCVLAALVFVPIHYAYPSRNAAGRVPMYVLGFIWGLVVVWLIASLPDASWYAALLSLAFPVYYFAYSLYLDWRRRAATG
jgi:phosphatidylcholine synthase